METLKTTEPHYIRCVKPNSSNLPQKFENTSVLHQLRCGVSNLDILAPSLLSFSETQIAIMSEVVSLTAVLVITVNLCSGFSCVFCTDLTVQIVRYFDGFTIWFMIISFLCVSPLNWAIWKQGLFYEVIWRVFLMAFKIWVNVLYC